ncbi:hypothetical protein GW796_09545 [archaeon]|nr:hypothetical protein [archaeon]
MIKIDLLRYKNTYTMKLSDEQLHLLNLRVDFLNEKNKEKTGSYDYERILLEESKNLSLQKE